MIRTTIPAAEAAYVRFRELSRRLKIYSEGRNILFATQTGRDAVLSTLADLKAFHDDMTALAATPGVAKYATDSTDDPTYNVVTEYAAMLSALGSCIAEIVSTFPTQGNYVLERQIDNQGNVTPGNFNAPSLAPLRALLSALELTIE